MYTIKRYTPFYWVTLIPNLYTNRLCRAAFQNCKIRLFIRSTKRFSSMFLLKAKVPETLKLNFASSFTCPDCSASYVVQIPAAFYTSGGSSNFLRWSNQSNAKVIPAKHRRCSISKGVRGHAPPENFENCNVWNAISRVLKATSAILLTVLSSLKVHLIFDKWNVIDSIDLKSVSTMSV